MCERVHQRVRQRVRHSVDHEGSLLINTKHHTQHGDGVKDVAIIVSVPPHPAEGGGRETETERQTETET